MKRQFYHRLLCWAVLLLPLLSPGALAQSVQTPVTGLLYFVIEDLDNDRVIQRGTAGSQGVAFDQIIFAPNTRHRVWILEATTLRVGRTEFTTPGAGRRFEIPEIVMLERAAHDADEDGLSDLGEFIMGTDPLDTDSDDDGRLDGDEVRAGENPLTGLAARIGMIDGVPVSGGVISVTAFNDLAIVTRGTQGLQVFNIFNRMGPVLVADVPTTGTTGSPGEVDCTGALAAAAAGLRGVVLYDLSDPANTEATQRIGNIGLVTDVATAGRYVYAANFNREVILGDMITGVMLDRRTYPGPQITDLAIAGDYMYVLSTRGPAFPDPGEQIIHKIAIAETLGDPVATLEVSSPDYVALNPAQTHLAAGGGLVYVSGVGQSIEGRITASIYIVRDEGESLTLTVPPGSFTAFDLAINGSGRAVFTQGYRTSGNATVGQRQLGVADVSDPDQPAGFITSFELLSFDPPTLPRALTLYNGLAYVLNDATPGFLQGGGLQVANYMPLDRLRTPPTVSLETSAVDGTVVEGRQMRVTANATDDVQVRNVEFYMDGERIATDGNFPFEYWFDAPDIVPEKDIFTLRARASDTGGNAIFSETLTISLTPAP